MKRNNMGLIVLAAIVVIFLIVAVVRAPNKPAPEQDPLPAVPAAAPGSSSIPQ